MITYSNELYHHGVLGMKWGVRRYQNKDGSLTYAGKKKALKIQDRYTNLTENGKYRKANGDYTLSGRKKALKMREQYSRVTGGKNLVRFAPAGITANSGKPKKISEMSNQEISAKIERIRLENTLKSLTPQKVSSGKKFVDSVKSSSASILKDKGTKIVADFFDKEVRRGLGLGKDSKSIKSKRLQQEAEDARNRYNIANFNRLYNNTLK